MSRACTCCRAPELRLLGEGLDAIIQHTRQPSVLLPGAEDSRLPIQPTEQQRLERYAIAAALHPAEPDPERAFLRLTLGEQFRDAWKLGKFPKLRRVRHLMPVPLHVVPKAVRA